MKKNKHQSDKSPKDLLNKAKMIMSSIQTKILLLNEQEPEKETLGQKKDDLIIDSPKEDSIETFVKEYKQNIENKCKGLIDTLDKSKFYTNKFSNDLDLNQENALKVPSVRAIFIEKLIKNKAPIFKIIRKPVFKPFEVYHPRVQYNPYFQGEGQIDYPLITKKRKGVHHYHQNNRKKSNAPILRPMTSTNRDDLFISQSEEVEPLRNLEALFGSEPINKLDSPILDNYESKAEKVLKSYLKVEEY